MPVNLVGNGSSLRGEVTESGPRHLSVGLINNMPDAALKATERQFMSLLEAASGGLTVRLSLFALPDVPRAEAGFRHIKRFYSGVESLWDSHLDGLIVTGSEPRAGALTDEPYWRDLAQVIDWAEQNTSSSIWSCLGAHAAALRIDGIGRRRLRAKRFGVFECARAAEHPLTIGVPPILYVPHSRWNDLSEHELDECGYRPLTRARSGGMDGFVKQRKSLFVCFQGHPEYEANTLLLEYRRDIGSYLRRERDGYPAMPHGFFDRELLNAFASFRQRAMLERCEELIAEFPIEQAEHAVANTWRSMAVKMYSNWLAYLSEQKDRRTAERQRWNPSTHRAASLKAFVAGADGD